MKRELSKIGELATYVNGYAFKPSDWSLKGRPIIRIQDLTGNDYQTNYYEGTLDERYKIKKGDLLISWSASIGIYEWEKEDAWLNQHIFKVVFDKGVDIEKKYFQYAVGNALKKVSGLIHGSTMKHLTKSAFDSIQVPLYSVDEQQKIVQRLEAMQRSVDISKKEIATLDTLVKSRFIEMFGDPVTNNKIWTTSTIGDTCFVTKLAGFEYTKYIHYQDCGDVIMIRGLNVKDTRLKLDNIYFIEKSVSDALPRSQLKENDIVMTYVGVNIGDVALVDGKNRYHLAPNVAKISPYSLDNINSIFFVHLLAFNKERFAYNATNTAKQALNMDRIRKLVVMLPPIALQNQFAEFVQQVDKSKSVLQKLLEKQELLRAALMQEYFG